MNTNTVPNSHAECSLVKTLETIAAQEMNYALERGIKSFHAVDLARKCLREIDPIEHLICLCQKEREFRNLLPGWSNLEGMAALSIAKELGINLDKENMDARLIAAAPDLLEALQQAIQALNTVPRFRVGNTDSYRIASLCDRAVAKVTGRA